MTILDKLIERKDIEKYIDARIWKLKKEKSKGRLLKMPPKERETFKRHITQRIRELKNLKTVICKHQEKSLGQTYWEDTREFREQIQEFGKHGGERP